MDESNQASELDAELKELYKVVSDKIRLSISNQKLSTESFQTILLKVVDTIEEFSSEKMKKITGTEKRAIAMNLTELIIKDLHDRGQIDDEMYNWMSLALTFLAPILFDAAKSAWKKIQNVVVDIEEHGTTGCCKRNFFTNKKKVTK